MNNRWYDDPNIPNGFPDQFNMSDLSPANITFGSVMTIWGRAPALEVAWKSILVFFICLVGLVGNFLVIFLVLRQPKIRQQPVNIYIVNLAIADFLTTLFTPIIALINNIYQNYELGPVMCKLQILIQMMCILASIFSVIAISFQRFLNITRPTSGTNTRSTKPQTLIVIIIIWIISILLAMPLAIWRTYQERQWKDYLEKWCTDEPVEYSVHYWIIVISPIIYIPLIVMVVMYWLMIIKINRFIRKLQQSVRFSSNDSSVQYNNSANSSLKDIHELQILQEKHRKRMQERRKKQARSKTEPPGSLDHSNLSYFGDELHYNPSRRSSSISLSSTCISPNSYRNSATPTYIDHNLDPKNLQAHIPLPLPMSYLSKTTTNISDASNQLQYITHSGSRGSIGSNGFANAIILNGQSINPRDGATTLQQQLVNRQTMSANMHKKSIMITIVVFCLITFFFWLPLQVLVYYRAFKPKGATMACWYEKTKFIAQMLCSINSAINPFITFRRTFSQMYQQFRSKQKQRQLRQRLLRNQIKLNPDVSNRKPKPSLVETLNMTPIVQVIEVIQDKQYKEEDNAYSGYNEHEDREQESLPHNGSYPKMGSGLPRRRKTSKSHEVVLTPSLVLNGLMPKDSMSHHSSSYSNGHVSQSHHITPIESDSVTDFDPVAQYMENLSDLETPTSDVASGAAAEAFQLFSTEHLPPKVRSATIISNVEQNKPVESEQKLAPSTSIYTHNLTKQMLMKYTPEKFVDE